jgi:hypothetical protein
VAAVSPSKHQYLEQGHDRGSKEIIGVPKLTEHTLFLVFPKPTASRESGKHFKISMFKSCWTFCLVGWTLGLRS